MINLVALLLLPCIALAQNTTSYTATNLSATTTAAGGTSVVTAANVTAFVTSLALDLDDLWTIFVGPVQTADVTTTVSPTPIPSSSLIPPPFLYYPSFPPGRQVPNIVKNESWAFPKDFFLGVAGAAYQIEGAARAEGRGPSIWDTSRRIPNFIINNVTGDVTDNHYYLYKQDIARLAAIGVNTYSFSISWPRLFPFGAGPINELGIAHYNDVINTCLHYNITPMATLYHWDLPLFLQDTYGGWLSERIVDDFTAYAELAFSSFGDRVKHWFTFNEPHESCTEYPLPVGYFKAFSIPDYQQPFICAKNLLLSHGHAYRLGKQIIPDSLISFKNNGGGKIPASNSSADAEAVQRAWDFVEGWFSDPVFLTGDFPESVLNFTSSFLTPFTTAQKQLINQTADFYAHDAYTSTVYAAPDDGIPSCLANTSNPLWPICYNSSQFYPSSLGGWPIGPPADPLADWLNTATDWLPQFLHELNTRWPSPGGIMITEFGFAEPFESLKTDLQSLLYDPIRTNYFHDYLEAILIAISEGVDVIGCLAWSFLDNLEWTSGFSVRYGLQYVNYTTEERYYKASFFEYVDMFRKYVEA